MNTVIIQLFRLARINAPHSGIVLSFDQGFDLGLVNEMESFFSDDGCYIGDNKYTGPWEGIAGNCVELHLSRDKLRKKNIICRDTLDEYISSDLGISGYTGFRQDDHITIILDLSYKSFDNDSPPRLLQDTENCCALFHKLWEMSDLKNGTTVFFLLEEPLEIPNFSFRKELIHHLQTDYETFTIFFAEDHGNQWSCLKYQLMKFLQPELPEDRLSVLFSRFDEIFQNSLLAFDRLCAMNSEDKLAVQLEKESLDILERSRGILDSLKAEILVMATNAIGFGYLDFSDLLSVKNCLIVFVLVLINTIFTIVLCNSLVSLKHLKGIVYERRQSLIDSNPKAEKRIEKKSNEFISHLKKVTVQFYFCIFLLWLPLIIFAIIVPSLFDHQTQEELAKMTFILYR
ncbi:MAG: hypothetical protein CVV52_00345 [Spirochaetae bacterium HGW-Spirochaetae-8]|jgi:phage pi2 protein 07|nr:MAG: hypothetical protein CVV52_00345 [Spirochaetae bacterium HGW-Spirochaetae-8]